LLFALLEEAEEFAGAWGGARSVVKKVMTSRRSAETFFFEGSKEASGECWMRDNADEKKGREGGREQC
jgi:hypothetical protein